MTRHLHKRCLNQSIKAEKLENHFWQSSLKCTPHWWLSWDISLPRGHISSLYREVTSPPKPLLPMPAPRLKQVRYIRCGLQHRSVQNCANRSFQKLCPEILMCPENHRLSPHHWLSLFSMPTVKKKKKIQQLTTPLLWQNTKHSRRSAVKPARPCQDLTCDFCQTSQSTVQHSQLLPL